MSQFLSTKGLKMKLLMVIIGVVMLTGCGESGYKDYTESFTNLPEGLKDCKIYYIKNGKDMSLSVVRCPNSTVSTTYKSGKTTLTTVVIDGKKYVSE